MADVEPRSLRGLLVSQFFGAFNDHALKFIVALLGFRAIEIGVTSDAAREAAAQSQTTLAFVTFTLPLMVFSLPAGVLADRYSKRSIVIAMKLLEVVLMAGATLLLFVHPSGGVAALVLLGLMGLQSSLFSPAKYGILPEAVPHELLSAANGRLEMWTFLAIVSGTAAGGLLLGITGATVWLAGACLLLLAVTGFIAALGVPRVPAARPGARFAETVRGSWRTVRRDRLLWLTVIGQTAFWAGASLISQDLLVYAKSVLELGETTAALPLALLIVGIGAGSMLAGRMSNEKIEVGLIPLGAILFSAATLVLGLWSPGLAGTLALLFPVGVASGLMLVPLDALLQWRAPRSRRGGIIALTNTFAFGGVLAGSLGAEAMSRIGLSSSGILVCAALLMVGGTAWAIWLMPLAFLRMIAVVLTNTVYRQRTFGREHVPASGGVLLVPNHVSFVDGIFLVASIDRPVRFIVDAEYFDKVLFKMILRPLGAVPLPIDAGPKAMVRALRSAGAYLDAGEVVCVFAEGQITRTGALQPFKRGIERIAKGRDVPIVPVYLHGVWGSIFSYERERFVFKLPKRVPYPVTVKFGEVLRPGTPFRDVRVAVERLGAEVWAADERRPLHHALVASVRLRPFAHGLGDSTGRRVTRIGALAGAVALARRLRDAWDGQDHVGILLPPSVAAALVNFAASLAGRTSVNLNYTTGRASLVSGLRTAGVRSVVTSRAFLDKVGIELPDDVDVIHAEDVAAEITRGDRIKAFCLALFAPKRMLERSCGARRPVRPSDVATVIFSSGSTGDPKGVMLTHANIAANVAGATQVFRLATRDRVLGILPMFHSFGYLLLWVAASEGIAVAFCPNPLDAAGIGATVQRERVTVLVATPTFLQLYAKRCSPESFGSLRIVVTGAEKLPQRIALAFEDTFGVRPLEGYGVSECSPVVAASAPDYRAPGFYQAGSRRGFVGRPLPGVAVRVVDPESFDPLPAGESGLLLVRGPNVMKGYLGQPGRTAEVMRDGWYVTGDIALVDADGFVQITGRQSRFSKIGGEMVPHGRVEEVLQAASGEDDRAFAVTSLPDPQKGERLAVVHTVDPERLGDIVKEAKRAGLPNLFVPRLDDFVKVEALPLLGTGKLDLRALDEIVVRALRPAKTSANESASARPSHLPESGV